MKSTYRELAKGTYPQPCNPDEHKTLEEFADMEAGIIEESADKVQKLLKTGGDQQEIAANMSSASSAIEGLDAIVHLKRKTTKGQTP